jgi:HlyD family secretion protein
VPQRQIRRWRWTIALPFALILFAAGGVGYYWWKQTHPPLPVGISFGNGRIEADEIDVDTKYAGRVSELLVDIGDMVAPGQVVGRMDSSDIEQSLSKSQAQGRAAQHAVDEAKANLTQQQTQQTLAEQEMDSARSLLKNGWTTQEIADQRQQQLNAANAGLAAARSRISESEHALEAIEHDAELLQGADQG